jgi:hypothetical protein
MTDSALTPRGWRWPYLVLWALWIVFAISMGIMGGKTHRWWWWVLVGAFLILEGIGMLKRTDDLPMLTEVFGRYIPAFVLFPVLALASWRMSMWVPGWVLWPGTAWQLQHFIFTYHAWGKMGIRGGGET